MTSEKLKYIETLAIELYKGNPGISNLKVLKAIALDMKAGFDPNQPRDESGQWGKPGTPQPEKETDRNKMTITEFEKDIEAQDFESGALYDQDGNLLFWTDGEAKRIRLTEGQVETMRFNPGAVFTHNHPSGRSFSMADLATSMKQKMSEIRAVSPERTYRMELLRVASEADQARLFRADKAAHKIAKTATDKYFNKASNALKFNDPDYDRKEQEIVDTANFMINDLHVRGVVNSDWGKKMFRYSIIDKTK